jgi:hypothetical protein
MQTRRAQSQPVFINPTSQMFRRASPNLKQSKSTTTWRHHRENLLSGANKPVKSPVKSKAPTVPVIASAVPLSLLYHRAQVEKERFHPAETAAPHPVSAAPLSPTTLQTTPRTLTGAPGRSPAPLLPPLPPAQWISPARCSTLLWTPRLRSASRRYSVIRRSWLS